MMIVMKEGASDEEIAHVVDRVESIGLAAHVQRFDRMYNVLDPNLKDLDQTGPLSELLV